MSARSRLRLLVPAVLPLVLGACGDPEPEGPEEVPLEVALTRERVASLFVEERYAQAIELIRSLADLRGAALEDLLAAAVLHLHRFEPEPATAYAERAVSEYPDSAAAHFVLGMIHKEEARFEQALSRFRSAHRLAPDDVPSRLMLANTLDELERADEAAAHYRAILAEDPNTWGSWMVTAAYRLGRISIVAGDDEGYEAARAREDELRALGLEPPEQKDMLKGELGKIPFPPPRGTLPAGPAELAAAPFPAPPPAELAGFEHVAAWTQGRGWPLPEPGSGAAVAPGLLPRPDLVAWGARGLRIARAEGERGWRVATLLEEPVEACWPIDWDDDGWLDFALLAGGELVLRRYDPEEGTLADGPTRPELPSPPRDAVAVDYDHDGDVDLLLAGAFGARIWRNDGLHAFALEGAATTTPPEPRPPGAFTDATAEARLPADVAFDWCVAEDFDVDQDVDLLFGSAAVLYLADDLRGGVFADRTPELRGAAGSPVPPIVADLNGDELPDLWFAGAPPRVLFGTREGAFLAGEGGGAPATFDAPPVVADLDLDGSADAAWIEAGVLRGRLSLGLEAEAPLSLELPPGVLALAAADLDAEGRFDLALAREEELALHGLAAPPTRSGFGLALTGEKDNLRGVGAIVEVRAGPIYRRIHWRGQPALIGLGERPAADIVRVTWPNGVVQHVFDVPAGADVAMRQVERMAGSCPFLYTWNGTTYEFVTDVLGITPLGLPMAPGMLVPPDNDEYVLVTGEQLRPRRDEDGLWYDVQVTEELREVTYLDHARLLVVDHPADTELYPNELFRFPPFPERHEHVVRDVLAPVRAPGGDGRDWARELASLDGRFAEPFEGYRDQFQGLAAPWTIELQFDPGAVREGERLRLLCTGWLLWTNASVNMAAARTPGVEFLPPVLQVPDGDGGWRDVGPPVGFPAGKTKTMVIDVTDVLDPDDPRVRLRSTLCLYWDSIRLAVGDDGPTEIVELAPVTAELWDRGFSEAIHPSGEYKLEWFVWDRLTAEPPWNQHPGLYTRYGETRPLLTEIDDRFVVMGAGDALRLRFDAEGVPPVREGWRRDFLLFLDGWAKDRDPNTLEALEVEPLPFHGMSGYPYGPDESFPDTEAHRRWREEWQTRRAKTWIRSLAPAGGS